MSKRQNENVLQKEHRAVVNFRNVIIYEYFGIYCDKIWGIIHNNLKNFNQVILKSIEEIEKNLKRELMDAFIEGNKYLDFVVKELKMLKSTSA